MYLAPAELNDKPLNHFIIDTQHYPFFSSASNLHNQEKTMHKFFQFRRNYFINVLINRY